MLCYLLKFAAQVLQTYLKTSWHACWSRVGTKLCRTVSRLGTEFDTPVLTQCVLYIAVINANWHSFRKDALVIMEIIWL